MELHMLVYQIINTLAGSHGVAMYTTLEHRAKTVKKKFLLSSALLVKVLSKLLQPFQNPEQMDKQNFKILYFKLFN